MMAVQAANFARFTAQNPRVEKAGRPLQAVNPEQTSDAPYSHLAATRRDQDKPSTSMIRIRTDKFLLLDQVGGKTRLQILQKPPINRRSKTSCLGRMLRTIQPPWLQVAPILASSRGALYSKGCQTILFKQPHACPIKGHRHADLQNLEGEKIMA